jgi:hypothetical protein
MTWSSGRLLVYGFISPLRAKSIQHLYHLRRGFIGFQPQFEPLLNLTQMLIMNRLNVDVTQEEETNIN